MVDLTRFISIANLGEKIIEMVSRFPVVVADFVAGTAIALYLVDHHDNNALEKLLIVSVIGFFMFLTGYIFSEKLGKGKIASSITVAVILAIYYFYLPKEINRFTEIHAIRSFLLAFVSIMAIMVAPYLKGGGVMGFWQYNRKLFLRFAFTAISSVTLFAGISASIASFDYLFGVSINWEWYMRVWIFIVGIIATTIFTVGVPQDFENLEQETDYPKVIKIFTQFILLPLIILYAVILYLYGGKIVLTGQWPKGLVSYLILTFSSIGIIANLLLYPEREKSAWVKNVSKIFWIILIPLMFLLYGAVHIRISDYGLTHERLFVVILGLWLLGLAVYFLFNKRYDIKIIFISLILVIILSVFGFINVFSISRSSQIVRLEKILIADKILVGGKVQKVENNTVSKEDVRQISSIVDYLGRIDQTREIQKWFDEDLNKFNDHYDRTPGIMKLMGLEYVNQWAFSDEQSNLENSPRHYNAEAREDYQISGYKYLRNFDVSESNPDQSMNLSGNAIRLNENTGNKSGKELIEIDLGAFAGNLADEQNGDSLPREKMMIEVKNDSQSAKIYFSNVTIEKKDGRWVVADAQGLLLFN